MGSSGQEVASRLDHDLMSCAFSQLADKVQILPVKHISDHCMMSLRFLVEEADMHADWSLNAGHRCGPGGCGERFALRWWPDKSAEYAAALQANSDLEDQFEQAIVEKDLEKACCLLQSLDVHAAGEPGVDTTRTQSTHLKHSRWAARDFCGCLMSVLCSAVNLGRKCVVGRQFMLARKLKSFTGLLCGGLSAPIISLIRARSHNNACISSSNMWVCMGHCPV